MNPDEARTDLPPPGGEDLLTLPPLGLYVHLPWCVSKCPYCDFNSHALKTELPGDDYIQALLIDLEQDLPSVWGRPVVSIFIGGGTPSLFSAAQIETLLNGIKRLMRVRPDAEVTLEANPGTTEYDAFAAYRDAGVNRVSLGVQSFDDGALERIGRIHGSAEVLRAIDSLHNAGINNFNIDLMFGLPGQSHNEGMADIRQAISSAAAHISHYQLTLEPNTAFHANPPELPEEDLSWELQQQAAEYLEQGGYSQYEVSAWSKPARECQHNINYWRFGDYLGIGAGAHGKITQPSSASIRRTVKTRHPRSYLRSSTERTFLIQDCELDVQDRIFEFFLNQLRLRSGVIEADFSPRTGLKWDEVSAEVSSGIAKGLLVWAGDRDNRRLAPTELGWRFVNETQALFLPEKESSKG